MEFIFGRAGAALLSPCHGEGQDVRRGHSRVTAKCAPRACRRRQFNFLVTAKCAPQAVQFSCHGKMCTAGSAIFVSRQDVHRGQCDFPVTAKCALWAGRLKQCDSRATAKCTLRAMRFSCHGVSAAAGSAIFLSRQDVRCGQCHFPATARCTLRAANKPPPRRAMRGSGG